ncbi:hypothetical protein BpHYR1_014065, partial [Brachionus plicatilis]
MNKRRIINSLISVNLLRCVTNFKRIIVRKGRLSLNLVLVISAIMLGKIFRIRKDPLSLLIGIFFKFFEREFGTILNNSSGKR